MLGAGRNLYTILMVPELEFELNWIVIVTIKHVFILWIFFVNGPIFFCLIITGAYHRNEYKTTKSIKHFFFLISTRVCELIEKYFIFYNNYLRKADLSCVDRYLSFHFIYVILHALSTCIFMKSLNMGNNIRRNLVKLIICISPCYILCYHRGTVII